MSRQRSTCHFPERYPDILLSHTTNLTGMYKTDLGGGPGKAGNSLRRQDWSAGTEHRTFLKRWAASSGRGRAKRFSERLCSLYFKLRDRTSGKPALDELGLRVPTKEGWVPAQKALFSYAWPGTQGRAVAQLIQLAGSVSPSIQALADGFVRSPGEWLPRREDLDEWTDFLRLLGVRDGLWPISASATRFRRSGSDFTPETWGRAVKLDPEFMEAWKSVVPQSNGFPEHPYTPYTSVGDCGSYPVSSSTTRSPHRHRTSSPCLSSTTSVAGRRRS